MIAMPGHLRIGIDPGKYGAIAVIAPDGQSVRFFDVPTVKNAGRHEYLIHAMAANLRFILGIAEQDRLTVVAGLEKVHAMPGQGVRSMFSMGEGLGIWKGLLVGMDIPHLHVTPQKWKRKMLDGHKKGKELDKGTSIIVACEMFPCAAKDLGRKKDHNRADALLLAAYLGWQATVEREPKQK